jgi:hypothetical protein
MQHARFRRGLVPGIPSPPRRARGLCVASLLVGCWCTAAAAPGWTAPADPAVPAPVALVFDTDIGNDTDTDVDDVLALGLIHALAARGECELVAVTITKDHPLAAPFTDAVNR